MRVTFRMMFLILLCFTACVPESIPQESTGTGRIVYGLTLDPSGFDPHIHRSSEIGIPLRSVYDTLIYRHPATDEFVPGLATAWNVSSDGRVYTFDLRQDVLFHDGTAFNAYAVGANLDRITNPETASQRAAFMLGAYSHYEIDGDYRIRIVLHQPNSALLDSFAQVYLGIASPAALAEYSNNRYQFHQVGTGPFMFDDFIPGNRLILKRNPNYTWGPDFYDEVNAQSVNEIEFQFFTDPPSRVLGLEGGTAQVMGELLPLDARTLTGNSNVRLIPVGVPGQPLQFMMNTNRFPTDSRAVRQALLFGSNRNAIIDAVFQRFSPIAWGPISATSLYYDRTMDGLYAYDPAQAESLLNAAGLTDSDNDGFRDIAGLDVELVVIVPSWGQVSEVVELLQDYWRTLGIRTTVRPVPNISLLMEAVAEGEYNLVAFNTYGVDPIYLNEYYLSDAPYNWHGYQNATLDDLLNQAAAQIDPNVRTAIYAQVQRTIMEEALILPIRDQVNLNASHTTLSPLEFDSYGWFPLLHNLRFLEGS